MRWFRSRLSEATQISTSLLPLAVKAILPPQIAAHAAFAEPSPPPGHTAVHMATWQKGNIGKGMLPRLSMETKCLAQMHMP